MVPQDVVPQVGSQCPLSKAIQRVHREMRERLRLNFSETFLWSGAEMGLKLQMERT